METAEIQTILSRLNRIEGRLRRMFLVFSTFFILGVVALVLTAIGMFQPENLEGRRLSIRDEIGNERIVLVANSTSASLDFVDERGKKSVSLTTGVNDPSLSYGDAHGKKSPRVELDVLPRSASLTLRSSKGAIEIFASKDSSGMWITRGPFENRIVMEAKDDGPSVELCHNMLSNPKQSFSLDLSVSASGTEVFHSGYDGKPHLMMGLNSGLPRIYLSDPGSTMHSSWGAFLYVDDKRNPTGRMGYALSFYNQDDQVIWSAP